MDLERFEQIVREAVASLPEAIRDRLDNVALVVDDRPASRAARRPGGRPLLGLYEGQPLTDRDTQYGMTFPDKITIFKGNLEAICSSEEELRDEVRKTVLHEIAHHFGIDDERLDELDY